MKLTDYSFNRYSQFGEDGIIQKIFEIIGTTSKICIEFGAWDGIHLSNTANLWTNGWQGILIECDKGKYQRLVEQTRGYLCHCIHAKVDYQGHNTLENILKRENLLQETDLLSIDVDGNDYYIFESLIELAPRVVVCEYNPTIPAWTELVPEPDNYFGCSALSLVKLAETKGYQLVAITEANCFFVRDVDAGLFSAYETSLEALATDKLLTYLISGFGGDYVASREPIYGCAGPSSQRFRKGEYYIVPSNAVASQRARGLGVQRVIAKHLQKVIRWIQG